MKHTILELFLRFTSRKFLLTLGAMVVTAFFNEWEAFTTALGAFLVSEGAGDIVGRLKSGAAAVAKIEQKTAMVESGEWHEDEDGNVTSGNEIVAGRGQ